MITINKVIEVENEIKVESLKLFFETIIESTREQQCSLSNNE